MNNALKTIDETISTQLDNVKDCIFNMLGDRNDDEKDLKMLKKSVHTLESTIDCLDSLDTHDRDERKLRIVAIQYMFSSIDNFMNLNSGKKRMENLTKENDELRKNVTNLKKEIETSKDETRKLEKEINDNNKNNTIEKRESFVDRRYKQFVKKMFEDGLISVDPSNVASTNDQSTKSQRVPPNEYPNRHVDKKEQPQQLEPELQKKQPEKEVLNLPPSHPLSKWAAEGYLDLYGNRLPEECIQYLENREAERLEKERIEKVLKALPEDYQCLNQTQIKKLLMEHLHLAEQSKQKNQQVQLSQIEFLRLQAIKQQKMEQQKMEQQKVEQHKVEQQKMEQQKVEQQKESEWFKHLAKLVKGNQPQSQQQSPQAGQQEWDCALRMLDALRKEQVNKEQLNKVINKPAISDETMRYIVYKKDV